MPIVTVYEFELFDPVRRSWRKADFLATALAVERLGGVVLHASARTVDAASVAPDGRLRPQKV